jgi:hypothetical protein
MGPQIWKGIGAAALIVLVGTAWLLRNGGAPDDGSRMAAGLQAKADAKSDPTLQPVDTAAPRVTLATDTTAQPSVSASASVDKSVPVAVPQPSVVPQPQAPSSSPLQTVPVAPSTSQRSSARWVKSISRDWVVVRTEASEHSRIVASIGPNSRVQLGETRGTWRRIRARGLTGWVEARSSFEIAGVR